MASFLHGIQSLFKPKDPESSADQPPNNEKSPLLTTARTVDSPTDRGIAAVYQDDPANQTYSRRLAAYLSQFSWYFPKENASKGISLEDAWAYFEHSTLARYHVNAGADSDDERVRAEPGEAEEPTRLYPVISTSEKDLADFGMGVGIYFFTLRVLAIIMLAAGIGSIPNLIYFGSDDYNTEHEFQNHEILRTSAVCTNQPWKACPNCTLSQWDYFPRTFQRYAQVEAEDGTLLKFIRINDCSISEHAGLVSYVVMLGVCLAIYVLAKISRWKERQFDDAQQTTSDYSVVVINPPTDAKNPEEWRTFFSEFGHVTALTIALDNGELLDKLVQRRKLLYKLDGLLPVEYTLDPSKLDEAAEHASSITWFDQQMLGYNDGASLVKAIHEVDDEIRTDFASREYRVSKVYVVYETEQAQQNALKALQVAGMDVYRNNLSALAKEDHAFHKSKVLHVVEPPEPSSIRWKDIHVTVWGILNQQMKTGFITVCSITFCCAFVLIVRALSGIVYAAVAVSAVTSAAPYICQYIIEYFESHPSEGSRLVSLYIKNTAFLWMTTTFLTALITPFVNTLDNTSSSLVPAMYAIFITEMLKSPLIQISDVSSNVKKHLLAPRAKSQKDMYYYFQGTSYDLSQRYTDLTNVMFLTFYYSMLFPAGYFLAALTLAVHYWVDKYCLLRLWGAAPRVGSAIANMSRAYFFSTSVVVYVLMSSYSFASFPYDNACASETSVPQSYIGSYNATTGTGDSVLVEIGSGDQSYYFCNQDMIQYKPPAFPAIPSMQPPGFEWMTDEQASFAQIYGTTSAFLVVGVLVVVLNRMRIQMQGIVVRPFKSHSGKISDKRFSAVPDLSAYIPELKTTFSPYPILFCNVDNIDKELIPWVDPNHQDYQPHNATLDFPELEKNGCFSTIHHWAP